MSFVKSLNPLAQFDIGGTDLGIPFRMPNGQIGFVLGDTFAGTQPQVGGPNWRRIGGRPGDRITARPVNAAAHPGGRPIPHLRYRGVASTG
ncbi:DUF4185 domain-containing protein [Rhodococcus jostii]|uniref:DUF4185 domain-containing protein n=1 Tax=Rhodococcus jostii TaxID=132919 RepID=UPI0002EC884D